MFRPFLALLLSCCAACALTPAELVVVYNADSPFSERMARAYCAKRGVSVAQLVPLRGVKNGDISREDFDRKVVSPLLYAAAGNDWSLPAQRRTGGHAMRAMVLMPDLPLRIRESSHVVERRRQKAANIKAGKEQGKVDWSVDEAACVDSELALLGDRYPLHGALDNPFFGKDADISSARPPVLAVTRIDGPDEACVRRMVEDPVRVERNGLWGWTVVDQGGPYGQGEKMFKSVAAATRNAHLPLLHETSRTTLADGFPLMGQTAVYFGWYEYKANGPFGPKGADFRFAPGAVAGHLHSFSCTSIKDDSFWAPALLKRGAAVTFGNVNEPYLGGCHDFGIFYDRLLKGYTVAEAALMATPLLSWQEVTFGDPLYRPFAAQQHHHRAAGNAFAMWQELSTAQGGRPDTLAPLVKAEIGKPHGALFAEALAYTCADEKKWRMAVELFRMAADASAKHADKLRNTLMLITALHLNKENHAARELMLRTLEDTQQSPYRPAVERTAESVIPKEWAEMKKTAEEHKKSGK